LTVRKGSAALRRGSFELVDAPPGVIAYRREAAGDSRLILINFRSESVSIDATSPLGEVVADLRTQLSTHPQPERDLDLAGNEARILR
jgi:hypothetical protein